MALGDWVGRAGDLLEGVGVASIVVGAVVAAVISVSRDGRADAYRAFRQALGKAILLGLEFLVAADIVRTVSHVPSLQQVAVLGGIVLIRTFLSFTLEVELEGSWPWQRRRHAAAAARPSDGEPHGRGPDPE
jgi:uncharacterized membrane protein